MQKYFENKYESNENIVFHGRKDLSDIIKISKLCRYGILPYEPRSGRFTHHKTNKFAEYLSLALEPIIHRELGEMTDFCKENKIGIIIKNYKELGEWWITEEGYDKSSERTKKLEGIAKAYFSEKVFNEKIDRALEIILDQR